MPKPKTVTNKMIMDMNKICDKHCNKLQRVIDKDYDWYARLARLLNDGKYKQAWRMVWTTHYPIPEALYNRLFDMNEEWKKEKEKKKS